LHFDQSAHPLDLFKLWGFLTQLFSKINIVIHTSVCIYAAQDNHF
jgi:hypothetical protein